MVEAYYDMVNCPNRIEINLAELKENGVVSEWLDKSFVTERFVTMMRSYYCTTRCPIRFTAKPINYAEVILGFQSRIFPKTKGISGEQ